MFNNHKLFSIHKSVKNLEKRAEGKKILFWKNLERHPNDQEGWTSYDL